IIGCACVSHPTWEQHDLPVVGEQGVPLMDRLSDDLPLLRNVARRRDHHLEDAGFINGLFRASAGLERFGPLIPAASLIYGTRRKPSDRGSHALRDRDVTAGT